MAVRVSRCDRGAVGAPCGCGAELAALRARLEVLTASVADLVLEIGALRAQDARRVAPSSRDARDELLLLLVARMFGDDSVQVVDVLARAAVSEELRQALTCAGAGNGWQLGNWFERIQNREFDGCHAVRIGKNGRGVIWRLLT